MIMKLAITTLTILWTLSVFCVESMRSVEYPEMLPDTAICYNNKAYKFANHKRYGQMQLPILSERTGKQLDCDRPRNSK